MSIEGIYSFNVNERQYNKNASLNFGSKVPKFNDAKEFLNEQGQLVAIIKSTKDLFQINNVSNKKVGTAIVLQPNDPEFKGLKILVKSGTKISNADSFELTTDKTLKGPSFKGHLYGSIGRNTFPQKMRQAYNDFFKNGMFQASLSEIKDKSAVSKIDYNFFVPTDGNGTRFRDYTDLQGETCKPAAVLPATFSKQPLKLVHATLMNFAKTGKLQKGARFVEVEGGKGSAYAFLEGLKSGRIPCNKPIVFSWGDNFSDIDLKKLINYHEKNKAGVSILSIPVSEERMKSLGALYIKPNLEKNFEVVGFKEKPSTHEEIEKSLIPNTKEYLASVGPYVFSSKVLKYLKKAYSENSAAFTNQKGDCDFSDCILTKLVNMRGSKTIVDKKDSELPILAYLKPNDERWSDLGNATDLIKEMQAVKAGEYKNLPEEIKQSVSEHIDKNGIVYQDKQARELFERFCKKYNIDVKDAQMIVFKE